MTVKVAAEHLAVSRPTLSNLLNGKAKLSPEMATRLEKAFGVGREKLLGLQAVWDEYQTSDMADNLPVRRHVPVYLKITAHQLENWADKIEARSELSVLLRKLVHTTVSAISEIDFPGYDNSQRRGWDGWLVCDETTPWLASGISGWEFGCNKDPQAKANDDYTARTRNILANDRRKITFVFVTPRNWSGKNAWVIAKNKEKKWKSVRAYDASDLEQWIEQSIPVQMWLAEILGLPGKGLQSLENCWDRWAGVTKPVLLPEIFNQAHKLYEKKVIDWLKDKPTKPFTIAADSKLEALAFLESLIRLTKDKITLKGDSFVVINSVETLNSLFVANSGIIPVICDDAIERELGSFLTKIHIIVIRPKNSISDNPDIVLDSLSHSAFQEALTSMGIERDQIEILSRESGGSLTVLRRRLAVIDAIKSPSWAKDGGAARALIPMVFVGAWDSNSEADRQILGLLADTNDYEDVEQRFIELSTIEETPVWAVSSYRGLISKVDALHAVAASITQRDIDNFFIAVQLVMSEADPALDLPEDERWTAGIYNKLREHSTVLRKSICETLTLLSVHGENLFRDRIYININDLVDKTIEQLLTPLTPHLLESQADDMPYYAEAAPTVFLRLLEEDLASNDPQTLSLMRPVQSAIFSGCSRSGILWALECLAWNPDFLSRVALILARLAQHKIVDNWHNKPENSLAAILRCWMPQTAAQLDERLKIFELIVKRYPDVGWDLCVEQFKAGSKIGSYNYRPQWRQDAVGAGQVITIAEARKCMLHALKLCLNWPNHNERTLGDLIAQMSEFSDEDQTRTWDLVDDWAINSATDTARAQLKEKIRRNCFTRHARRDDLPSVSAARVRRALDLLTPKDVIARHHWLFATHWIQESADDLFSDESGGFEEHDQKIFQARLQAMKEIWRETGFQGVCRLAQDSEAPYVIGQSLAEILTESGEAASFLKSCLAISQNENDRKMHHLMSGFLQYGAESRRDKILTALMPELDHVGLTRIMTALPFHEPTWHRLNHLDDRISQNYWCHVAPVWHDYSMEGLKIVVDNLRAVNRPQVAFSSARFNWKRLDSARITQLLQEFAASDREELRGYDIAPHMVSEVFEALDSRNDVSKNEIAQLEFLYFDALEHTNYGAPNLQRQLVSFPRMFIQMLSYAHPRKDGGIDPEEWEIQDAGVRQQVRAKAYSVLHSMRMIPGMNGNSVDEDKLRTWIQESRQLAKEYGRIEVCDTWIGQLLAVSPPDEDGSWPCEAVCRVLEDLRFPNIELGFEIGVYNSRGAHARENGGDQERRIAARYFEMSKNHKFTYPYVSKILHEIAERYMRDAKLEDTTALLEKRLQC